MNTLTKNKAEKVEFFGMTTAAADYLLKHNISYAVKGGSLDVLVEMSTDGKPQMYLLDGADQQLRRVSLPELGKDHAQQDGFPECIEKSALALLDNEYSNRELGELLYRAHYEDVDSRAALLGAAYDAAKGAGVTHATARWFGYYFVQDAFFGYGMDQEFTDQGVFRGPKAFTRGRTRVGTENPAKEF